MNIKKIKELETSIDYSAYFKKIYYQLYSNSNTSRAERIISDITKVLLCKLIAEQEGLSDLQYLNNEQLILMLKKRFPQSCEQFDDFSLDNEDVNYVLQNLKDISLLNAPSHIIGDAFQSIIGSSIRGDKGQFFTPKELVQCIVKLADIKNNSIIMDPACGTGGFLSETYSYAETNGENANLKLIGIDKDKDMSDLAFATTEIISKGNATILHANSLELVLKDNNHNNLLGTIDTILTNPPFGAKIGITDQSLLSNYEFGFNWSYSEKDSRWYKLNTILKNQAPQVLFIELCVRLLKNNGFLAIVLPEGIFGNKTLGYIWQFLKENGKIIGMIDCPRNTFQPSTDTKTNVLLYQKSANYSDNIKIAVAKKCGHDKRGRTTNSSGEPLVNDFDLIASNYRQAFITNVWMDAKLEGSYFVPRYLATKKSLNSSGEYITIGEMITKGYLKKKSGKEVGSEAYGTGDVPFIRTSDISNFEISADPTNAVSNDVYNKYCKQQNLEVGDILFIADGRYRIGKTAIITKYNVKSLIQSHIEILSLDKGSPFTPYEFLYLLNTKETQEQIRSLVFIQSTLGTIGNRIYEIAIKVPNRTADWYKKIHTFQNNIEMRAECLNSLKNEEHSFDL